MERQAGIGLLLLEGRELPVPVHFTLSLHPPREGCYPKWYGDCRIADPRDAGIVAVQTSYHADLLLGDGRKARVLILQATHDGMTMLGDEPLPVEPPPPIRWCDVLLVDDDLSVARELERRLKEAGYSTCVCLNGARCVLALAQMRPRLVLLDLVLPDLRGWELLANMRSHSSLKDIPVIALTHAADARGLLRFRGYEANDYLQKPDDVARVVERVQQFISPGESEPEALNEG